MSNLRMQFAMAVATVLFLLSLNTFNGGVLIQFEYSYGINWVFLPAGMRLLATLLFDAAGFVGLLRIRSAWCWAHWLARRLPVVSAGSASLWLRASLASLTPRRLMLLIVLCSMASPLLRPLVFAYQGHTRSTVPSYLAMFIGDFAGTLSVIYTIKLALSLMPPPDRVKHRPIFMAIYRFFRLA